MATGIITVTSTTVQATLQALHDRLDNPRGVLLAIGEDVTDRIKGRFATSTAPDGRRWQPNSQVTLVNYLEKKGGLSSKTGKITGKGQKLAIGKQPLIGETRSLATQIFPSAADDSLSVSSSMVQAAMQQFGGTKAEFPHLWGDIPARPFFPITPAGALDQTEESLIVDQIRKYLEGQP